MIEFAKEDEVLRNILLDAVAEQYSKELDETGSIVCSSRFQKQMRLMLRDPKKWRRNYIKPRWEIHLQKIAVTLLVISSLFFGTILLSPTVRASVIDYVIEWYETHIVYRFFGEERIDEMPRYSIVDLPSGYSASGKLVEIPNDVEITYENLFGEQIRFEYSRAEDGTAMIIDTDGMIVSEIEINGNKGILYLSTSADQSNAIVWYDEQIKIQYLIDGFVGENDLICMAKSVSES